MDQMIGGYKYLIDAEEIQDDDGFPLVSLQHPNNPTLWKPEKFDLHFLAGVGKIFLSPTDVKDPVRNHANMKRATELCMQHGYRLSLQLHKILGIE